MAAAHVYRLASACSSFVRAGLDWLEFKNPPPPPPGPPPPKARRNPPPPKEGVRRRGSRPALPVPAPGPGKPPVPVPAPAPPGKPTAEASAAEGSAEPARHRRGSRRPPRPATGGCRGDRRDRPAVRRRRRGHRGEERCGQRGAEAECGHEADGELRHRPQQREGQDGDDTERAHHRHEGAEGGEPVRGAAEEHVAPDHRGGQAGGQADPSRPRSRGAATDPWWRSRRGRPAAARVRPCSTGG